MTVLVCGDRNWVDYEAIRDRLSLLPAGTRIIQGGCRGADRLASRAAKELGLPQREYPADWAQYGRAAGPIRNRQMLDLRPDLVLAFHPDITRSRGTQDCIREAWRRGLQVEIVQR